MDFSDADSRRVPDPANNRNTTLATPAPIRRGLFHNRGFRCSPLYHAFVLPHPVPTVLALSTVSTLPPPSFFSSPKVHPERSLGPREGGRIMVLGVPSLVRHLTREVAEPRPSRRIHADSRFPCLRTNVFFFIIVLRYIVRD